MIYVDDDGERANDLVNKFNNAKDSQQQIYFIVNSILFNQSRISDKIKVIEEKIDKLLKLWE